MATHVASPHTARPKTPPVPQEDIGSVLHRFQKWSGNQPEPVRELTYEEAVARSRRRVYDGEDAAGQTGTSEFAKAAAADAKPPATKAKLAKSARAGKNKSSGKTVTEPDCAGNRKTARASSRKAASQPAAKPNTTIADGAVRSAVGSAYQSMQKVSGGRSSSEIISAPNVSFEQALAAHIPAAPLAVHADTKPVMPLSSDVPAVHLTVRLATEERDAVRERAHDLGITPSAYMRHCILEIDSLRVELEAARLAYAHAFAAIPTGVTAIGSSSRLILGRRSALRNYPSDGAWLTRLIHFVLPGKAKARALTTKA